MAARCQAAIMEVVDLEEKKVQTTLRFSQEFHEELRVALARRHIRSIQQAVDVALRSWLDADRPRPQLVEAAPAPAGATKEEQAQVARFLDFLRTGDPGQVELVTHALDLHQKKRRRLRKPS